MLYMSFPLADLIFPFGSRLRNFNRYYPEDERRNRQPQEELDVTLLQTKKDKPVAILVPITDGELLDLL